VTLEGTFTLRVASGPDCVLNINNGAPGVAFTPGINVMCYPAYGWGGGLNEQFSFAPQPGGWHTVTALGQTLDTSASGGLVMNPSNASSPSQRWYLQPGGSSSSSSGGQNYYLTNALGDVVPGASLGSGAFALGAVPRVGASWQGASMLWQLRLGPCAAGSYMNSNNSACVPCPSGTWSASGATSAAGCLCFDAGCYAARYSDLAASFGGFTTALQIHFAGNGIGEGRSACCC
jgi:hypothetical protein